MLSPPSTPTGWRTPSSRLAWTPSPHETTLTLLKKAQLGGFDNPDAVDGADYFAGQVRGRGQENGSPSTNAISALTSSGGKTPAGAMGPASLSKGYLNAENVSEADLEAAYEVYKAAALEQNFRNDLEGSFANRFNNEMEVARLRLRKPPLTHGHLLRKS